MTTAILLRALAGNQNSLIDVLADDKCDIDSPNLGEWEKYLE